MLDQVLVLTVSQHAQGAWTLAEFRSSSLPGVTSVPANQVDGVGWWEVAKTSRPDHNAPSSEENFYILWTI